MDKQKRQSLRRTLTQCTAFALSNGYLRGFAEGKIYKGKAKALCVPGLSCYSCPGALGSCPIGALQAVLDGGKFRFAAYVMGVLLLVGTLFGRLVCGWLCPFAHDGDKFLRPGQAEVLPVYLPLRHAARRIPPAADKPRATRRSGLAVWTEGGAVAAFSGSERPDLPSIL